MKKFNFVLARQGSRFDYSVEAGANDGQKHFDHHGVYSAEGSPCNRDIPEAEEGSTICVSHIDADTVVGLLKLTGRNLPEVDFDLMEQVDCNGSSVVRDLFNPTLLYMLGVGAKARELGIPRCPAEGFEDITEALTLLLDTSAEELITLGRQQQEASEKAYNGCLVSREGNKALFAINATDALDPSRSYKDEIDIVVVYRSHYKSISIYCNPSSAFAFAGETLAGIPFAGHPKASGSPRGESQTLEAAKAVFEAI